MFSLPTIPPRCTPAPYPPNFLFSLCLPKKKKKQQETHTKLPTETESKHLYQLNHLASPWLLFLLFLLLMLKWLGKC